MMEKLKKHKIIGVEEGSIAMELGIEVGDSLLYINDMPIEDVFDYRFMIMDEEITVVISKANGEEWELEIEKDAEEDIGLSFESGLMDDYRRCCNNCIFCFIDQMPPNMRETLYFKDDDSRLSFLQGNYVTLTNLSDKDIERIIRYRLSPINISVQTTNPKLRCKMLNNRFAGKALDKIRLLYENDICMNAQIVLCKGINDGDELKRSLNDLLSYAPVMQSVSVVPVGLTKFRDGLYPLEPIDRSTAVETIDIIEKVQQKALNEFGIYFAHASDELYITAGRDIPSAEEYDDFPQLENGVGMIRLLLDEADCAIDELKNKIADGSVECDMHNIRINTVTGKLAYPYIKDVCDRLVSLLNNIEINVYAIDNNFFGEKITVTGLITGRDVIDQMKDKPCADALLIPECMLRSGEDVLLDDVHIPELESSLQQKVHIVKSSVQCLVDTIFDIKKEMVG